MLNIRLCLWNRFCFVVFFPNCCKALFFHWESMGKLQLNALNPMFSGNIMRHLFWFDIGHFWCFVKVFGRLWQLFVGNIVFWFNKESYRYSQLRWCFYLTKTCLYGEEFRPNIKCVLFTRVTPRQESGRTKILLTLHYINHPFSDRPATPLHHG